MALAVLVVDDDDALRRAVSRYLRRHGCHVISASDGVAGLDALRRERVDVVVSDVQMSPRGGVWLYLEATALCPELVGRFLFWSSEPLPEAAAARLRSELFLLKPCALAALWQHVRELARRD